MDPTNKPMSQPRVAGPGPGPVQRVQCGRCNNTVVPLQDSVPGMVQHIIALVLLILGIPFCIWIPYCFDCGGQKSLRCPKCGNYL